MLYVAIWYVLNMVIPTTEKKMCAKKCQKMHEARHAISESYFKRTVAKRKLKIDKEGKANCMS
jgi:hypothetical protein